MASRKKPLYLKMMTMDEIIEAGVEEEGKYYEGADCFVDEFKNKAELNKFYNKFVREFNRENGDVFKIKRCNFYYDKNNNPTEIKDDNKLLQDFKVINTGRALELSNPIGELIDFARKFIVKLAFYVNLKRMMEYIDDSNVVYLRVNLIDQIAEDVVCLLLGINDRSEVKIQPALRPALKILKQELNLNNNKVQLMRGFKNKTFLDKAKQLGNNGYFFFINKKGELKLGRTNSSNSDFETIVKHIERYVTRTGKTDWHKNPDCLLSVMIENLVGIIALN